MTVTSISLLDRLRSAPSAADWRRLHDVYKQLIGGWLARAPGLREEADDLTQEIMLVVFREIAKFERQREGSFRAWLRQVAVNRLREHWRNKAKRPLVGFDGSETEDFLGRLEDSASDLASQWDREHDQQVFDRLLSAVQPDFQSDTWQAFKRFALDGIPAAQVAEEMGTTQNAVILAKARVLKRLREEAGILLD
jgi:RNA polymerase sigma-70 factor (ECF subfamily)